MKPYHPSNVIPLRGLLFLLLAALAGGALIGGLTFLAEKLVYLVCLFPILMGLGGGLLISQASRLGKVRNPWMAVLFSVLMGIVIYISFLFFSYLSFRDEVYNEVIGMAGEIDRAEVEQFIDETLEQQYGQPGFLGYLAYNADEGIQIGRVGSSSASEITLENEGAWIYWGIEMLVIIVVAVILGRGQSTQPFCEACDEWMGKEKGLGLLPLELSQEGLRLAESGMFRPLGEMLLDQAEIPFVALTVESCGHCLSSDSRLIFKQVSFNKKKQAETRVIKQGMVTPSQLSDLNYGMRSRPAAPAESSLEAPSAPQIKEEGK